MNIQVIEPYQVARIWEHAYPFLAKSQERGPRDEVTLADMRHYCMNTPSWRLVVLYEDHDLLGAAVVRVLDDTLFVSALGGRFKPGWHLHFFEWLKSVAGYMGVPVIRFGGRKGWRRLLAPLGFVPVGGPFYEVRL